MSRPRGPRIRTLKPEFWQDERVGKLSPAVRLLLIGLITMADDDGRLRAMPSLIVGHVYPYDDIAPRKLATMLVELDASGIVRTYTVDNVPYACFPRWDKHQRIDKPNPSELPPAPFLVDSSTINPRSIADDSQTVPAEPVPRARAGAQGSDRNGSETPPTPQGEVPAGAVDLRPAATDVRKVFDTWQESKVAQSGHKQTAVLDEPRRKQIQRALRNHPLDDVLAAVQGWRKSPHHRGENDAGTVYNDLELLLRNAGHIEKFRDMHHGQAGPAAPLRPADFVVAADAAHAALKARTAPPEDAA